MLSVLGVAENCFLCIDDKKNGPDKKTGPYFVIASQAGTGFSGNVCAAHLAALVKQAEANRAKQPQSPQKPTLTPVPVAPIANPVVSTNKEPVKGAP